MIKLKDATIVNIIDNTERVNTFWGGCPTCGPDLGYWNYHVTFVLDNGQTVEIKQETYEESKSFKIAFFTFFIVSNIDKFKELTVKEFVSILTNLFFEVDMDYMDTDDRDFVLALIKDGYEIPTEIKERYVGNDNRNNGK
ncbi:hypothetical protein JXA27_06625 [Aerococcaceae bacterium zg-B36]|uniref:hypothetical protein n=1 Tax=Aerococcaceae bacterium zg-252 TaxID=2796928 RepID=UPI001BD8C997|nr:hypothetical protein [Aerococcaceae bacterium zg-B36]